MPLFMFGGAPTPLWITPKFSIPISENRFNVGVGALMGTVTGVSKSGFGIAYGIGTIGSRDRNVSLGVGYGYAGGQWGNTPTITLSSMIRMSSKTYFLTENYFIPIGNNYYFMGSAGVRVIMGHVGMDFGFVVPKSSGNSFVAIPWLGVTVPFGKIPIRK